MPFVDKFVTLVAGDLPVVISCASLALADAGIMMYDLVAAVSVVSVFAHVLHLSIRHYDLHAHINLSNSFLLVCAHFTLLQFTLAALLCTSLAICSSNYYNHAIIDAVLVPVYQLYVNKFDLVLDVVGG